MNHFTKLLWFKIFEGNQFSFFSTNERSLEDRISGFYDVFFIPDNRERGGIM